MSNANNTWTSGRRVDLHCHSRASTETDEALLIALNCPESYSSPDDVYAQARRRGMDFVTLTDHDSLAGVRELRARPDVIVGEELTCYFPEDHCKIHLLLWGLNDQQHAALQMISADIYEVSRYVHRHGMAHAVAHPLYRQNDVLDRWHVERLLLMFNGFETLNGAHSQLHREAFEPLLDELDEPRFRRLERRHGIRGHGRTPWVKARTGGSDDHGLFNIGRTWTEFPREVETVDDVLACLRDGRCRPGGEAGSSVKLAHNFYGVGVRYYAREMALEGDPVAGLLARVVGDAPQSPARSMNLTLLKMYAGSLIGRAKSAVAPGRSRARGTKLLERILVSSVPGRVRGDEALAGALRSGQAPLAEHDAMFGLMSGISRDVAAGIGQAISEATNERSFAEIFDALSAIAAEQVLLLPYYFALFHQNQERHLLHRMTGRPDERALRSPRVGVFTDDLDPTSPAGAFARDVARHAACEDWPATILSCGNSDQLGGNHKPFSPLWSGSLDKLGLAMSLPPVLEVLEYADRKQFDAIVINSAGPMALCGVLVARMLRVPVIVAQHIDLQAHVLGRSDGDYRVAAGTKAYVRWLYAGAARVVTRSQAGATLAAKMGVGPSRISVALPSIPPAEPRDAKPTSPAAGARLVCYGNFTHRAEAELMALVLRSVTERRADASLTVVGSGPWTPTLMAKARGLAVHPAPTGNIADLATNGQILVDLSLSELSAHRVAAAMGRGLPAVVSYTGAAGECVEDNLSGATVPSRDPNAWADAILKIVNDAERREAMSRRAITRASGDGPGSDVRILWAACRDAVADRQLELDIAAQEAGVRRTPPADAEAVPA
jgi:glycosyltransferase involved in cell wall biosynthesis